MDISEHLGGPGLGATDDVESRGDKKYCYMVCTGWGLFESIIR
jgi:hypothetical protein